VGSISLGRLKKSQTRTMALLLVLAAAVASANAGLMQQMQMMQQQQQHNMVPMGNGGCQQDQNGMMPAGCEIPMGADNIQEYLEQQMEQQQYETQQMAERIKAQFEEMVKDVTMKKHRYVMSMVAEFVSFCECSRSSQIIYSSYLDTARNLNLTEGIEIWDANRQPFQAVNEEDARALIFGGLVKTMCETAGTYNAFAEQVMARIPAYQQNGKK